MTKPAPISQLSRASLAQQERRRREHAERRDETANPQAHRKPLFPRKQYARRKRLQCSGILSVCLMGPCTLQQRPRPRVLQVEHFASCVPALLIPVRRPRLLEATPVGAVEASSYCDMADRGLQQRAQR
ncbi:hypothetical protein C8J57DRAFT_1722146 [Mycena rebaudengoi]|nr:hypothetical protein C8J57DRAFT_1722146 [Mycena rebaudengoi]